MIVKHAYSRCSLMPLLAGLLALVCASTASAQVALQDIGFQALSDSQFEIELEFNAPPPPPEVFVIEDPARLTMDFTNVTSALTERRFPLEFASADSLMILEAQGRTRMVVNLAGAADYQTRVQGNSLFVTVLGAQAASAAAVTAAQSAAPAAASAATSPAPAPAPATTTPLRTSPAASGRNDIRGIDFRGGEQNVGEIIIDLARTDLVPTISRNGNRLEIQFDNALIAPESQMRLDVADFTTPVRTVSLFSDENNVVVSAQVDGEIDYVAAQEGSQYIVSVLPVVAAAAAQSSDAAAAFSENRISLDYQNIEIRSALQILAEFNDFSLVVGDNVTGNITLRLENVPWDQALDLILRPRNLGQRLVGTVLYVAPADEIAAAELQQLQSAQETDALAPLVTEYIEINYAVAANLLPLLQGSPTAGAGADAAAPAGPANGGILSSRGRASVDARTNTLIIQDVQEVIDDARALIARLDVPVRQVLIEARIVNASTSFSQALGVRWGGAQTFPGSRERYILSGSQESSIEFGGNLTDFSTSIASAVAGGTSIDEALATTAMEGVTFPDALLVDLGVAAAPASIALGYSGDNGLLELELSALEASGNGEVIAQPKVTTQDQQAAKIESGLQIPYQSQAGGTAGGTTTQFVTAALSLEVTPQITPDGRIIMELDIHQDSVVPGGGGGPPAISTNSVTTRVLVNDGDTIVLGGVFREETTTTVTKTPLLGDLPYVGNIFKRTEESEGKTELLIFITPSIINEILQ